MKWLDLGIFEITRYSSGHLDILIHLGALFLWVGNPCGRLRFSVDYVRKRTGRDELK